VLARWRQDEEPGFGRRAENAKEAQGFKRALIRPTPKPLRINGLNLLVFPDLGKAPDLALE
jgi:hypothetical protein